MKCFDKRLLIGLAVAAVAMFAVAPTIAIGALPLLLLLACPLAMMVMMRGMGGHQGRNGGTQDARLPGRQAELTRLRQEVNVLRAKSNTAGGEAALGDQRSASLREEPSRNG